MTDDMPPRWTDGMPDSLMAPVPHSPENRTVFRLAQMLLLLDVARRTGRKVPSIDRLGYYEFFADSPFIVVDGHGPRDEADRLALELAGFTPTQLSYASSGQRFASRRRRLQHDVAVLISLGLVELSADGYRETGTGAEVAAQLNSVYADAYRTSADVVLRRLSPMSNRALDANVNRWLGESWLLIDLLDDVSEAVAPRLESTTSHGVHGDGEEGRRGSSGMSGSPPSDGDEIPGQDDREDT